MAKKITAKEAFEKTAVSIIDGNRSRSPELLAAVTQALANAYKRGKKDERKRQAKNRERAAVQATSLIAPHDYDDCDGYGPGWGNE